MNLPIPSEILSGSSVSVSNWRTCGAESVFGDLLHAEVLANDQSGSVLRVVTASRDETLLVRLGHRSDGLLSSEVIFGHEFALAHVIGREWGVRPLRFFKDGQESVLVLEDYGGVPLSRNTLRRHPLEALLPLAVSLASAIRMMHSSGLVHHAINPGNVLVGPESQVWLTNFGQSLGLHQELGEADTSCEIPREHFPFLPPERLSAGVSKIHSDPRSDLYSLGVLLFQLLSGELPFHATDRSEWTDAHLYSRPRSLRALAPGTPPQLEFIVSKLLFKAAEDRYQTAAKVQADLQLCLDDFQERTANQCRKVSKAKIAGLADLDRVYGRAEEIDALRGTLSSASKDGALKLVFVEGEAGIGKTSLVAELQKDAALGNCWFASSRFDAFSSIAPYGALFQVIRSLIKPLLGKPSEELSVWVKRLRLALGGDAHLLTDRAPELETLIGSSHIRLRTTGESKDSRLIQAAKQFFSLFKSQGSPLIILFDDAQLLDGLSRRFLASVVSDPAASNLILIVAFRNSEDSSTQEHSHWVSELKGNAVDIVTLELKALAVSTIASILSDYFHGTLESPELLADHVHRRTGGNPSQCLQFIRELVDESVLYEDTGSQNWVWESSSIEEKGFAQNIVQSMIENLRRLALDSRRALAVLGCIGGAASDELLGRLMDAPIDETRKHLLAGLDHGLITKRDGVYSFSNQRVREDACEFLAQPERSAVHTQLATRLLGLNGPNPTDEQLFSVVDHLNQSNGGIDSESWRLIANLNVAAAIAARRDFGPAVALKYYEHAYDLAVQHQLEEVELSARLLLLERADCLYLLGQFSRSITLTQQAYAIATTNRERMEALRLRVRVLIASGEYRGTIQTTLEALRLADFPIDRNELLDFDVHKRLHRLRALYDVEALSRLADESIKADERIEEIIGLIAELTPSVYISDCELFPLLVVRGLELVLEKGLTSQSGFLFGLYAIILVGVSKDLDLALRVSELSVAMNERYGNPRHQGAILHFYANYVLIWRRPFRSAVPLLEIARKACVNGGDYIFSGFASFQGVWHQWESGAPLDDVISSCQEKLHSSAQLGNQLICYTLEAQRSFLERLKGDGVPSDGIEDPTGLREQHWAERIRTAGFTCAMVLQEVMGLMTDFYEARFESVISKARALVPDRYPAKPFEAVIYFAHAIALMRRYGRPLLEMADDDRLVIQTAVKNFETWSRNCAENYASRLAMLKGYIATVNSDFSTADQHFNDALSSARQNHLLHHEALAHELSASAFERRGLRFVAEGCLKLAKDAYSRWGAGVVVRRLEQAHAFLRENAHPQGYAFASPHRKSNVTAMVQLSQAVSGEIDFDSLVHALMNIALRHSAASRVFLILKTGEDLRIEAVASSEEGTVRISVAAAELDETDLPLQLIRYVARTTEAAIVEETSDINDFMDDPYVRDGKTRSIMCLPLVRHQTLVGVLYLENKSTPYVFDLARVELMRILTTQAAISIENARLYDALKQENANRKSTEDRLRRSESFLEEGERISKTGTWVWNRATGSMSWSRQNYALWGIDTSCSNPTLEICAARIHASDRQMFLDKMRAVRDSEQRFSHEFSTSGENGRERRLQIIVRPVSNAVGETGEYIGSTIDVTERRASEAALRRSEMNLKEAQRLSDIGSFAWCVESGSVSWSEQTYRILEINSDDAPSIERLVERIHADDVDVTVADFKSAEVSRNEIQLEFRACMPSGAAKRLRLVARPVFNEATDLEYVGALADITATHHAQDALLRAQSELTHVTRVSTLGELTASIAHDLKQPLMAIITHGEAGLRWLNRANPSIDEAKSNLSRIVSDADRASETINRLRALARKDRSNRASIDVVQTTMEVLALVRPELDRCNIRLRLSAPEDLPSVVADKIQIQQVIMNLISNGVHSILRKDGQVREIGVRCEATGDEKITVFISDTGTGITPEVLERLFDPFFTTKVDGMGLGLSICRSILEEHRGDILAFNNANLGATFCFRLPIYVESESTN
jgi:predicted ATPase/signal transduction histidine kinase